MRAPSIPHSVLDKIIAHRPHLRRMAENIALSPAQIEKALANAYLAGETRLTVAETWKLAACSAGRRYGENAGDEAIGTD